MTKAEYEDYVARVEQFFAEEGIENLSLVNSEDGEVCPGCGDSVDAEPHFSWRPCECCGRDLGGDRYHVTGYNTAEDEITCYDVCPDCLYFSAYGMLDDMTMMDMSKEEYEEVLDKKSMKIKRITAKSVTKSAQQNVVFQQLDSLDLITLAQLIDMDAASYGLGYEGEKTAEDAVPESLIKKAQEFEEETRASLMAWVDTNKDAMVDDDVTGDDFYNEEGPYLVFMTLNGSGRTFKDGDWDHLVKDPAIFNDLDQFLTNKLISFVDDTGGGSLNEAIMEAAYRLYGKDEEDYEEVLDKKSRRKVMKKRVTATSVARKKAQNETETIGGQLQAAELSDGGWHNFGDINYLEHGGVQLRIGDGGDTIDYVDVYPADELDAMLYGITYGTFWMSDLIENSEELEQEFGSQHEWPISQINLTSLAQKVARYVGMDIEHVDILALMLGVASYGGVEANTENVAVQEDDLSALMEKLPPGLDI